jgi:hypothetical protein
MYVMSAFAIHSVTIAVQGDTPALRRYCRTHTEVSMPEPVVLLLKRARNCPIACFLKILFLLLLLAALYLSIYPPPSVSLPWYAFFLGIIAVEAALMLFANNNCLIRLNGSSR